MQISTLPKLISMFIVDALIGNWNRHNGGSCLFPQADEKIMQKALDNPAQY